MASIVLRTQHRPLGIFLTLALGLNWGCGSSSPADNVDAGQRRYCNVIDSGACGKDTGACAKDGSGDSAGLDGSRLDGSGLDSSGSDDSFWDAWPSDASPSDSPLDSHRDGPAGTTGDLSGTGGIEVLDSQPVDGGRGAGDVGGTGDGVATGGTGGSPGTGGAGGSVGLDAQADTRPDTSVAASDGPLADRAPDSGPPDAPVDAPLLVDTPVDTIAPDRSIDLPPQPIDLAADQAVAADTAPSACRLGGFSWAKQWTPQPSFLATAPNGTVWSTGNFYGATTSLGKSLPFTGGASLPSPDIFLAKLDPATGLATEAFDFGDVGDQPQTATSLAVASGGNVGLVGAFTGEIDFTGDNSDGSGPSSNLGKAGLDFLQNNSAIPFYAVFDGTSTGTYITPLKAHMVDVGTGALLSVGSNPGQNAIAICGKTSKAVPNWSDNGGTKGVITGGNAAAGGGMDIVVAKIDATTGLVLWGKQFGGAGDQICESASIDNSGDVIIAGGYTGTLNFGGTTTAFPVVSDTTLALLYVAKLNGTTGAAIAAQTWGSGGRSDAYGLAVDASNNILIAGSLGKDIDFGGGISILDLGLTDAFVVKLASDLTPLWAKSFGDSAYDQTAKTVAVSSKGDVLLGGSFKGSLGVLGPSSTSNTALDAFLAQLSPTDGSVVCAHGYGDATGAQQVMTIAVARAATGALADSLLVSGTFQSQITLGTTPTLDTGGPATMSNSFVARAIP